MVLDTFVTTFREEHRQVRDTLLELIDAFQDRDQARIGELLNQTAEYTGPHFRYEEEALYPGLVDIYGEDYIESLLQDHDGAIASARRLVELAGKADLTDAEVQEAIGLIRGLLPHVSDCEGLSIMVERLPEEAVETVLEARDRARQANLNLLEWAESVRERPHLSS
ncbi:MAG TPA: hemerythrin domain-containing protein [bacterium]|nr:hemerythrin domain-containing protein [bacterium]